MGLPSMPISWGGGLGGQWDGSPMAVPLIITRGVKDYKKNGL